MQTTVLDTKIEHHSNGNIKSISRFEACSGIYIFECFYFGGGRLSYTEKKDGRVLLSRFYDVFGNIREDTCFSEGRETIRSWYENGILESRTGWMNGKKHGLEEKRDEAGRLRRSAEYKNGEEISFSEYDSKGVLVREGYYFNGGFYRLRYYYENGVLSLETVKNPAGEIAKEGTFYRNGKRKSETEYKDNIKQASVCLTPSGVVIYSFIRKGGAVKEEKYNGNGVKLAEYNTLNGLKHGLQAEWFYDGRPKLEEYYIEGKHHNFQKEWDKYSGYTIKKYNLGNLCNYSVFDGHGTLKEETTWQEAEMLFKEYRNGFIIREELSRAGKYVYVHLYENESTNKRIFDENGNLIREQKYLHGKMLEDAVYERFAERERRYLNFEGELVRVNVFGVEIDINYYKNPETIPVEMILNAKNQTVSRALLHLLGYSLFLQRVPHKVLHNDGDYSLVRIDLPLEFNRSGRRRFEPIVLVKVKCPTTGMFYTLRVPPETRTCKEALAWTFGVNEEHYELEEEA